MALKAILWDRTSPINKVPAAKILEQEFYANMDTIMLVQDDDTKRTTEIQDISNLRMTYKLPTKDYTDQQVCDWYQTNVVDAPAPEPEPEQQLPTQTELDLMDGQALLFEQTSQILAAVSTPTA